METDSKKTGAGQKSYIKVISVLCSFTILLSVFAIGTSGVSAAAVYTAKTTATLNLRSGAGTSYSSLGLMDEGESVTLLASSSNGWIKVKAKSGKTGYCSTDFLAVKNGQNGMSVTAKTTDYLNLRSGAGTSYSSLEVLSDGATATVLDNTDNVWIKVKSKSGKTGYISRDYATVGIVLPKDDDVGGNVDDDPTMSNTSRPGWFEDSIADGIIGGESPGNIYNGTLFLSETAISLEEGAGKTLTAFLSSTAGAQAAVTWKSSNPSVATVAANGAVGAVSQGTSTVTATLNGSNKTASCKVTVTAQKVKSVTVSPSSTTLQKGAQKTLQAVTVPANKAVTWKSSNTGIATVTSAGVVKAVGAGTATITCTAADGGASAVSKITVTQPVTSIVLNTYSIKWNIGKSGHFYPTVSPENATNKNVTWKSSNTSVATVSSAGLLTAVGAGTATITCTASDGSGVTAKCNVTVLPQLVTSIKLNTTSISWDVGKSGSFTATVSPSNATNKNVTWKSSNTSVATVSSTGLLKAVGAGTATITCTAADGSGVTAKCSVTVKAASISGIVLSSTASSIYTGNHAYIKAVTTPANKKVTYSSSNTSVATVTQGGIVTGVSAGKAVITVKDPSSSVKNTYTITVTAAPSGNVSISNTTAAVPADKTFYLKSYTSGTTFKSSDTAVATVTSKGFVYAKGTGVAIISATANGRVKTCAVTVTAADPVRFAYTSPNSAALGDTVTFYAITDKTRDGAKFEFTSNGKAYSVTATSKTADASGTHYIWKGSMKISYAGTFTVTAYASKNGAWSTCADGKTSVFVSNVSSASTVSFNERRASDGLLRLNADYEGFLSSVTDDPLVSDAPTLGYGKVVTAGEKFYNNLSKDEAYAYLVQTMNGSSYTSAVNNFMKSNNIKFNQQQFDALVMLVYNLGSGVLGDSDVKRVLLDCVESGSTLPASSTAYVNSSDGLMLRTGPGTSYNIITVMTYNTKVTVVEKTTSSWYKVKLSDGTTGYCASEYLTFASTTVRNLNLVSRNAVIGELIQWHHAGGQCVWGLLYRRIDELEVFFYADYKRDGSSNKYNMQYNWNC